MNEISKSIKAMKKTINWIERKNKEKNWQINDYDTNQKKDRFWRFI